MDDTIRKHIARTRPALYPEHREPKKLTLPAWLFQPDAAGWVEVTHVDDDVSARKDDER